MNWTEYVVFRLFRLFRKLPINRLSRIKTTKSVFNDYFKNFEKVDAVRKFFGERTKDVLNSLAVDFTWVGGYMFVDNETGHLVVNRRYLHNGDKVDIYLDLIHELCHVRQLMEGKQLFDPRYRYVERPTEIEAYRYTVQEAKRLGLSDERICEYLKTEWMNNTDFKSLAKALDVVCK
jgi:hypothetical protein